jgi:hypothetical protein
LGIEVRLNILSPLAIFDLESSVSSKKGTEDETSDTDYKEKGLIEDSGNSEDLDELDGLDSLDIDSDDREEGFANLNSN